MMGTVEMPGGRMSARRLNRRRLWEGVSTTAKTAMLGAAAMMRAGPWIVTP
jgi:hypothetical protein